MNIRVMWQVHVMVDEINSLFHDLVAHVVTRRSSISIFRRFKISTNSCK